MFIVGTVLGCAVLGVPDSWKRILSRRIHHFIGAKVFENHILYMVEKGNGIRKNPADWSQ